MKCDDCGTEKEVGIVRGIGIIDEKKVITHKYLCWKCAMDYMSNEIHGTISKRND